MVLQAWDVTKPNVKEAGSFDILVASNLSTNADHLPTALANIYNTVAEGGFLMLSEMTGPLGALFYGLEGSAWEHQDGRKFGPCTSVAHWKQLLSDAGFAEVSVLRSAAALLPSHAQQQPIQEGKARPRKMCGSVAPQLPGSVRDRQRQWSLTHWMAWQVPEGYQRSIPVPQAAEQHSQGCATQGSQLNSHGEGDGCLAQVLHCCIGRDGPRGRRRTAG